MQENTTAMDVESGDAEVVEPGVNLFFEALNARGDEVAQATATQQQHDDSVIAKWLEEMLLDAGNDACTSGATNLHDLAEAICDSLCEHGLPVPDVHELERKLDRFEGERDQARRQRDAAQERIKELERELEEANRKGQEVTDELNDLKAKQGSKPDNGGGKGSRQRRGNGDKGPKPRGGDGGGKPQGSGPAVQPTSPPDKGGQTDGRPSSPPTTPVPEPPYEGDSDDEQEPDTPPAWRRWIGNVWNSGS